ncbi:Glucokinase regulatory protein [Larimichthys crocea]|uniref:Uncharacterized protein n=1 Tax=Larimichthys crocea TaxID=215358 RepID=A0ACD3QWL8_LARCR|nr:Glucokinase regulatory protein [Larimichthys crocea]
MAARSDWTCSLSTMHEWESPDYEPSLPVSEKSNPLTRDIDRASANCIVQMLQACDAQMFQEETGATYQRLLSERVVETLMEVAQRVELILKDPQDSLVVLSGCGTSGRMAFLITKLLKMTLNWAVLSLKKVRGMVERVFTRLHADKLKLFSAPCQLDFCLRHSDVYTPVLVGFNPAHQARGVLQCMKAYEQTLDITYAQSEGMTALLEAAGQSLRRGGRVCYLGWGSLAVLGLVDASECDPTFGAGERSVMYEHVDDNTVQNHTQEMQ